MNFNRIKSYALKLGLTLGIGGSGLTTAVVSLNNFSHPHVTAQQEMNDIQKLNPKQPIGVMIYNQREFHTLQEKISNAARNNLIQEMHKHYGTNIVVLDDPSPAELQKFSHKFNAQFSHTAPEVHFAITSHYSEKRGYLYNNNDKEGSGQYKDATMAHFLQSVHAHEKRAVIFACGPKSEAYHLKGFDYVVIPSPDGMPEGSEASLKFRPAYSDAIGLMRHNGDAKNISAQIRAQGLSRAVNLFTGKVWNGYLALTDSVPHPYKDNLPAVVTPPLETPHVAQVAAKLTTLKKS